MMFGLMASFMMTVIAPAHPRSSAVMGSPEWDVATTIRPILWRRSWRSEARARIAIISLAAVLANLC